MHRFRFFSILFFLALATLYSCDSTSFDCARGNGKKVSETRSIEPFKAISAVGPYHVYISQGTQNTVLVEADENIISKIETKVTNGTLVIGRTNDRCLDDNESINIFVTVTELEAINLSGSGLIQADSLSNPYFNIRKEGSGSLDLGLYNATEMELESIGSGLIKLHGKCINSRYELVGSGEIRADNLLQEISFIDISGSGIIFVQVSDLLDVAINGSGKVYYKGSPRIDSDINGSGSIIRL